jgi:hypothetical protein
MLVCCENARETRESLRGSTESDEVEGAGDDRKSRTNRGQDKDLNVSIALSFLPKIEEVEITYQGSSCIRRG